ncbi:MAG: hypothetical protein IKU25_03415 [Clostridia bacterium]|nr:hypothetical protein [Clostridia bacterium]
MRIEKINGRCVLVAAQGKLITDGNDVLGKQVFLELGRESRTFYEIPESEVTYGIFE